MQWLFVVVLASYALQHGWPAAKTMVWLRWLLISVALGIWLAMTGVIVRGEARLTAMGRDLRPAGSWSGPYRSGKIMTTSGWVWSSAYCTGLVLLLVFAFCQG